jgi:hypothetical protein
MTTQRLPLALKLAYTAWIAMWAPLYWLEHGPANFLWFCDFANWVVLLALWLESPLLLSTALVGVGMAQTGWFVDFFGRLLLGFHPIRGTEYMFDSTSPVWIRALSLFHLWMLPLLVWLLRRTGYRRGGFALQSALAAVVLLPLSYLCGTAHENLNWVYRPFEREQPWLPPWAWLLVTIALCPLVFFWPVHWLASRFLPAAPVSPSNAIARDGDFVPGSR